MSEQTIEQKIAIINSRIAAHNLIFGDLLKEYNSLLISLVEENTKLKQEKEKDVNKGETL